MGKRATDLKGQLLLAAFDSCQGDLGKTFTFEELLVSAWRRDRGAWGLRGFEQDHPDSERIHRELDSRGKGNAGLIDAGLLERVQTRVYRLSVKGLAAASELVPQDTRLGTTLDRKLEDLVCRTLEHPSFKRWLSDANEPKRFRDAGHFWGIAPGTPPNVIRDRIDKVDQVLQEARHVLEKRSVEHASDRRQKLLFELKDIDRCSQFQATLKQRFADDLRTLGVQSL